MLRKYVCVCPGVEKTRIAAIPEAGVRRCKDHRHPRRTGAQPEFPLKELLPTQTVNESNTSSAKAAYTTVFSL